MLGVYLAVNAVPDIGLVVDGPDCALFKAEYIYGNHDLQSTLLDAAGPGRIVYTEVDTNRIIMDRSEQILSTIARMESRPGTTAVLLAGMPIVTLTGIQHDLLIRKAAKRLTKPVWVLPEENLSYDWNDGYGETLNCIAQNIKLPRRRKNKGGAAVVGYFMNRGEPDEAANLLELERIFDAMSLKLISVWPSGRPLSHLREAAAAEVIVSLPPARKAAAVLAERVGARLINVDMPFGFSGTQRFAAEVGGHFGREKEAEQFIEEELRRYLPGLRWAVPHLFLHKRALYAGPAFYIDGFLDIAETVGIEVMGAALTARGTYRDAFITWPHPDPPRMECEVDAQTWYAGWSGSKEMDFMVSDSLMPTGISAPRVDFGFPSFYHHAFYGTPYLGIGGAAAFLGRIADVLYETNRRNS